MSRKPLLKQPSSKAPHLPKYIMAVHKKTYDKQHQKNPCNDLFIFLWNFFIGPKQIQTHRPA